MYKTIFEKDEKLWKGYDIPPLYNPTISIAQVLLNAMKINGPKVAQISDDSKVEMTYDDIRLKTIRAAQNLQKRGHKENGVYSFIVANTDNVAPILFATFCNGCAVNGLDPSFKKFELIHMLGMVKPDLVICDIDVYERASECLKELQNYAKIFTLGGCADGSEPVDVLFNETKIEDSFIPTTVDGLNDIALITCSSGTTGMCKSVSLSHAALINSILDYPLIGLSDTILCFSTIYWLSAWFFLLAGTFRGSTRIITRKPFSPKLGLNLIERFKINAILNTPHQVSMLLKSNEIDQADLSTIKILIVSGSKFHLDTKIKILNYLRNATICNGYGMSEVAGYISCDFCGDLTKDTVGQILNGSQIKIVDENGSRCDVEVDGEICIKPKYKFLGYYGSPNATNELFDAEGFVKSGDIGHFDNEGKLYVVDRTKDLLNYCMFPIAPSEIEEFLMELSAISEACIVGIPDEFAKDLPAALIVRNKNVHITEDEVYQLVSDNLADSRKLRGGVYFVDSLPTTPSGKVKRKIAKAYAIELFNKNQAQTTE
ncbi:hypothetical protein HA402_003188 [Bradysia odoriphaga]|nr:hypothetical protein HA402_003188 [Bradysia odoriphaga]